MPATRSLAESGYSALNVGRLAGAPPPADWVDARVLGVAVSEVYALPTEAKFVNFSANADFYAKFGLSGAVTAAIPAADVTDGSAPMLNPGIRQIPTGVTHIALIAPAATIVTIEVYI